MVIRESVLLRRGRNPCLLLGRLVPFPVESHHQLVDQLDEELDHFLSVPANWGPIRSHVEPARDIHSSPSLAGGVVVAVDGRHHLVQVVQRRLAVRHGRHDPLGDGRVAQAGRPQDNPLGEE